MNSFLMPKFTIRWHPFAAEKHSFYKYDLAYLQTNRPIIASLEIVSQKLCITIHDTKVILGTSQNCNINLYRICQTCSVITGEKAIIFFDKVRNILNDQKVSIMVFFYLKNNKL